MSLADQLLDEARRVTGLADFGAADFREGLEVYCDSVSSEAQLSEFGRSAVHGTVVRALSNRARVVDWVASHPDVTAERVGAPLVVIGMFRAGTTLLSNLLDQDPGNRALLRWEADDSVPPPTADTARSGPRVEAVRAASGLLEQITPAMRSIHHEDADGPTEDIAVMAQDFKSLSWEAITNVPAYSRWLRTVDQRSAYRYHRLVLQVLQSGGVRGRWTLKSPHHAIALEALREIYPNARMVLLHRDPVVLCASACSLIRTLSGTFSEADHTSYIATHWPDMLETSINRVNSFREAHPAIDVIDVRYADLVRRPLETVAAIYAALGESLSEQAAFAIDRYLKVSTRGQSQPHRYDIRDFGLDPAEIAERFEPYRERYGIPVEIPR